MHWLAQILAFYFCLLTLFPCSDSLEVITGTHQESTVAATHNHGAASASLDLCTPLCSCACCGVVVPVAKVNNYTLPKPIGAPVLVVPIKDLNPVQFTGAIFHPPRV